MKRCAVDYREFRLSKIGDPRFSHLKMLLCWVIYFALYGVTERWIPVEDCMVVHSRIDDVIPFCGWFLIPYVLWYGMIVVSLGYFLCYDVAHFRSLQSYFFFTQMCATAIYILFPTRQDLRPTEFAQENWLTDCIALLYRFDTNTGVCPSLHVAGSIAIASAWCRGKDVPSLAKWVMTALSVLVCLSTMFIKQHSALDVLAAIPMCLMAEWLIYGKKNCQALEAMI